MRRNYTIGLSILLILAGFLLLLQNFGILPFAFDLLWALIFGAAGLAFVAVFAGDQRNWWAIIPGFTLLGLGGLIGLSVIFPRAAGVLGGTLFLGAIGLSFWVIYLVRRDFWWAVIPGGTLITLAVVAGMPFIFQDAGIETGGVFFLGLAATFGLVYLLPTPEGRMRWAIFPAGILGLMGLLMLAAATSLIGVIWPLALILGGVYLVFRTFSVRRS